MDYAAFLGLVTDGHAAAVRIAEEVGFAFGRLIAAAANVTMAHRIILTGEGWSSPTSSGGTSTAASARFRQSCLRAIA